MKDLQELLSNSSVEDIKKGYKYDFLKETFVCLFCEETFEKGIIYPIDNSLCEAEKAVQRHIAKNHGSVFECLINMDKKYNDLSDIQKEILKNFYQKLSDKEIVEKQGSGSTSTIRNHRFKFKEKETQAKVFLAIMGIINNEVNYEETIDKMTKALSQGQIDELFKAYSKY